MIGTFGDIVFEVSDSAVKTFDDLKISRSAKYTEHAIAGRKGLLEFTGFNAADMTMQIRLDATLGVWPYPELRKLRKMFSNTVPFYFVLNGEQIGDCMWVIENYDINAERFDILGNLILAIVSVKLKEYVGEQ